MPNTAASYPKPALPAASRWRLLAQDMPEHLFTQALYWRLSLCFGHIAHYGRHGFLDHYFRTSRDKHRFLQDCMDWIPIGDPAWTWCDVELALQRRIRESGLLEIHGVTYRPTCSGLARPLQATLPPPAAAPPPYPSFVAMSQGDLFAPLSTGTRRAVAGRASCHR